jgi:hypothetical protein
MDRLLRSVNHFFQPAKKSLPLLDVFNLIVEIISMRLVTKAPVFPVFFCTGGGRCRLHTRK